MVTTVAPTTPVEAARMAPTITTAKPRPPLRPAEELAHREQQVLGDAGALEDEAHEDEDRDRHQGLVRHHAEVAGREADQQDRVEVAEQVAEAREQERGAGERESDREAEQRGGTTATNRPSARNSPPPPLIRRGWRACAWVAAGRRGRLAP